MTAVHDEQLESMQLVAAGWLAKLEANKYTEAVISDIHALILDIAIITPLADASNEPDPECTTIDNVETMVADLASRFIDLRDVVDCVLQPRRALKRKASDEVVTTDDVKGVADEAAMPDVPKVDGTTASGQAVASSSTASGSGDVGTVLGDRLGSQFDVENTMSQPGKWMGI